MKDRKIALMGITAILLISLIIISNSFFSDSLLKKATANPASETDWMVNWLKIYENNQSSVGSETWSGGSFHYDWGDGSVYKGYKDYISFSASATVYSEGRSYKLELSNVDDDAWVYLDGNEILHAKCYLGWKGSDSVNIPISEGSHSLTIVWKEYSGGASIGFSAPQELFEKGEGIPGFEFAFLIIAIASLILLKRRNQK